MVVQKKQIEAFEFLGNNFDELKEAFPQLKKYEREGHEYTVGWDTYDASFDVRSFTEALPGFFIVKNDGADKILSADEFKEKYQS
jgi:hypothetical protein